MRMTVLSIPAPWLLVVLLSCGGETIATDSSASTSESDEGSSGASVGGEGGSEAAEGDGDPGDGDGDPGDGDPGDGDPGDGDPGDGDPGDGDPGDGDPGGECGDGVVQGMEECDDANLVDTDDCTSACMNAVCGDGFVHAGVEECDDGNMINDDGCLDDCTARPPATCDDISTNMDVWGQAAQGVDLRDYTSSTLHWIGCAANTNGCRSFEFYCDYDEQAQTLQFGTTESTLRALLDPGDAAGEAIANQASGCCTAQTPDELCNAPNSVNNGVNVDMVDALCAALGYQNGAIVREVLNLDDCPEAHAVAADGSDWDSDWVSSTGWGAEFLCSQN